MSATDTVFPSSTAISDASTSIFPVSPVSPEAKPSLTQGASNSADKVCAWPGCGKPCRKPTHEHCSSTCRMRAKTARDKGISPDESRNANSPKAGIGQKLRAAGTSFAEKFNLSNPFAKKPHVLVQDLPNPQNPFAPIPAAAPDALRGAAFRKLCRAFTQTAIRGANAVVKFFAKRADLSDEFIDGKLLKSIAPEADVANFSDALDDYLRSINYVPDKPEKVNLMIAAVNLGAGYVGAIGILVGEIKRKNALLEKQVAQAAPTPTAK